MEAVTKEVPGELHAVEKSFKDAKKWCQMVDFAND
jgi:hypothetical protein